MGMFTVWIPGRGTLASGTFSGKPMEPGDFIRHGRDDEYYLITKATSNNRVEVENHPRFGTPAGARVLVAY